MSATFLEVTFRHGRAFAAYLRPPRAAGTKVDHSREVRPGLVVDFAADDWYRAPQRSRPSISRPVCMMV